MNWKEETERRMARGAELFRQGYNCSQSVTMALAGLYDVPEGLMARMSASFGGGIGRMRETCGAATGMFMLAGLEEATEHADKEAKARNYAVVQRLADDFRRETGSLLCRELLAGRIRKVDASPTPDERTEQYYQKRPCGKMVEMAIGIYMTYLKEKLDKG